jgi:hypothetical protein
MTNLLNNTGITSNTVKFKTRITKDSDVIETTADVNWDGVTNDQLKALALRSVIIGTQAMYRMGEYVPAIDEIVVVDMLKREKGGFKATPKSIVAKVNKMTPEQRAEILEQLMNADV